MGYGGWDGGSVSEQVFSGGGQGSRRPLSRRRHATSSLQVQTAPPAARGSCRTRCGIAAPEPRVTSFVKAHDDSVVEARKRGRTSAPSQVRQLSEVWVWATVLCWCVLQALAIHAFRRKVAS
ncbi:hypothetical protein SAMD00023353_4700280 [Rosellinia necatrix]|uniref:Uncharacterized protein n=1 Tax=Rosellinia necatrix TaxID=77044 RepID=A0A1S8A9K1_ROSNE|nr:hypothetical protein SAMD00023353_4700280 [Rosellinia necatrix]